MKDKEDKELIIDLKQLHELIFVLETFSMRDLVRYELVVKELVRRGYDIEETRDIQVTKRGGDQE